FLWIPAARQERPALALADVHRTAALVAVDARLLRRRPLDIYVRRHGFRSLACRIFRAAEEPPPAREFGAHRRAALGTILLDLLGLDLLQRPPGLVARQRAGTIGITRAAQERPAPAPAKLHRPAALFAF